LLSNSSHGNKKEGAIMITTETTPKGITRLQRKTMRHMPFRLLKEAYEQLLLGLNEQTVCTFLGVDPELFHGVLKQAIAEILWERGYFAELWY